MQIGIQLLTLGESLATSLAELRSWIVGFNKGTALRNNTPNNAAMKKLKKSTL
jgi:hypothetical protein